MPRKITTYPWALATAVPLVLIFGYAAKWVFGRPTATDSDRIIFIGACVLLCLCLAASTILRRERLKTDRRLAGQCLHCGYDLRATPGRCPECGAKTDRMFR